MGGGTSSLVLGDIGVSPTPGVSVSRCVIGDNDAAHQAPGGTSTLCLGDGTKDAPAPRVSSNHFAQGSNQNAGNFITECPTTRVLHAPGGASSICLADDGVCPDVGTSANRFSDGANQNSGSQIDVRRKCVMRLEERVHCVLETRIL